MEGSSSSSDRLLQIAKMIRSACSSDKDQNAEKALDEFLRKVLPDSPLEFKGDAFDKYITYNPDSKFAEFDYHVVKKPFPAKKYAPYAGRLTVYNVVPKKDSDRDSAAVGPSIEKTRSISEVPDDAVLDVFKHLSPEDLSEAGRVCQRGNDVARNQTLWQNVNVEHENLTPEKVMAIIPYLQSELKRLRICYGLARHPFDFLPLFEHIREHCPRLKVLMLENMILTEDYHYETDSLPSFGITGKCHFQEIDKCGDLAVDCIELKYCLSCKWSTKGFQERKGKAYSESEHKLLDLTVLSLRRTFFHSRDFFSQRSISVMSNIKILDLSFSSYVQGDIFTLIESLIHLKELYLSGCEFRYDNHVTARKVLRRLNVLDLEDSKILPDFVSLVKECGENLKKLYLCNSYSYTDMSYSRFILDFLNFNDYKMGLKSLEVLCLRNNEVVYEDFLKDFLVKASTLKWLNLSQIFDAEDLVYKLPKPLKEKIIIEENDKNFDYCNHYLQRNMFHD